MAGVQHELSVCEAAGGAETTDKGVIVIARQDVAKEARAPTSHVRFMQSRD